MIRLTTKLFPNTFHSVIKIFNAVLLIERNRLAYDTFLYSNVFSDSSMEFCSKYLHLMLHQRVIGGIYCCFVNLQ